MAFERGDKSPREDPRERALLESLTAKQHWESKDFTAVMVALARFGEHAQIPAPHRPETIDLSSWDKSLSALWQHTAASGHEHGRFVFADMLRQSLILGRIAAGNDRQIILRAEAQPGREVVQRAIASIHTHPETPAGIAKVFSAQDYYSFLSTAAERAMLVAYGPHHSLLVLKTSVTPAVSQASIQARIQETYRDFALLHRDPTRAVVEFNKMLCVEFGLTLYRRSRADDAVFRRIEVTR